MVIIIGAGISGTTVARNLNGEEALIVEKENHYGGLSTQYTINGYQFDFGGHYFHFQDKKEIKNYLDQVCKLITYKRKSRVFLNRRYIPFPLQLHLSFLHKTIRDSIHSEMMSCSRDKSDNLRDFLLNNFGSKLYEIFFEPFLSKYYQLDLHNVSANMDKGSIPVPERQAVSAGYRGQRFSNSGYNPVFYYPKKALGHFFLNYIRPVEHLVRLNEEVLEIDLLKKKITTRQNHFDYDILVNTMPLRHLVQRIKQNAEFPDYNHFKHISTLVVNVVLQKKRKRFHWVYLPEKQFPFYRVGFYPAHEYPVSYLEKTVTNGPILSEKTLKREVVFTLKKLGIINKANEIRFIDTKLIPVSYILFDRNWRDVVPGTLKKLKKHDVLSTGRYGTWNYTSMSDDVKSSIAVAEQVNRIC